MSETRRAWSGIGILTLLFVILLILQMSPPYLGWSDPEVEDGFVIDEVVNGLGGPACLEWVSDRDLLVCDRDGDVIRLLNFDLSEDEWKPTEQSFTLLTNVHEPHDILILDDHILVSERGKLTRINQTVLDSTLDDAPRWTLIDDIPTGNHQTNNLDIMPNGTVIWHVGSTCNICDEVDERNAALLWVNSSTGAHGILASGVEIPSMEFGCRIWVTSSVTTAVIGKAIILLKKSIYSSLARIMAGQMMILIIQFLKERLVQS